MQMRTLNFVKIGARVFYEPPDEPAVQGVINKILGEGPNGLQVEEESVVVLGLDDGREIEVCVCNLEEVYVSVAVTGRIPGDDEDSCYIYSNMSTVEARKAFEEEIYEDRQGDGEEIKVEEDSERIYINFILGSSSPIEQIYYHMF